MPNEKTETSPRRSPELTFRTLREANMKRLPLFRNAKGERAHAKADGSDWALSAWMNAVTGEVGEAANIIKKIERGDMTLDEARNALAFELADIVTYIDILAAQINVDLGERIVYKWNEVSKRVGCRLRMMDPGRAAWPERVLSYVIVGDQ